MRKIPELTERCIKQAGPALLAHGWLAADKFEGDLERPASHKSVEDDDGTSFVAWVPGRPGILMPYAGENRWGVLAAGAERSGLYAHMLNWLLFM